MHYQPKCPTRKHKCKQLCVSSRCAINNPFICEKCENKHEQGCQTMLYKQFIKEIHIIQGLNKKSILQFQTEVEETFRELMDSLRQQFIKFRELFENFNAPQQVRVFYQKIKQGSQKHIDGKFTSKILELHKIKNKFVPKSMIQMRTLKQQIMLSKEKILKNLFQYIKMEENTDESNNQYEQNKLKTIDKRFIKERRDFLSLGLIKKCQRDVQQLIGKRLYNIQLAFRASQNEFQAQKFHKRCDGMSNTLILAETQFGKIVGAYCKIQWKSPSTWIYQEDPSQQTFLFSLSPLLKGLKFKIRKKIFAIGMHKQYGPCFGDDFVIYNKANTSKSCWSNFPDVFQCDTKQISHNSKTIKEFIGVEDHFVKFNLKEWEVYKISFSKDQQIQRSFMQDYNNI